MWGDAAVTENSLTRAVALLRHLLGDDIRQPRFIETVPTAGYRFISAVEIVEDGSGVSAAFDSAETGEAGSAGALTGRAERFRWKWVLTGSVAAAVLLSGGVWYLSRPLPPPRITEYKQITHDGHIRWVGGTDGSRIYFESAPDGSVDEVGIAGGEIARVPISLGQIYISDVSSNGSNLLVGSVHPRGLWSVDAVEGSPRFITNLFNWDSWSPDGRFIASSGEDGDLYVMRSDGTDFHKLFAAKGDLEAIAWSPDGSLIRFTLNDALWEVTSSGSNLRPLLPGWKGPPGQCCGRWTPDGELFVFLAGGSTKDQSSGGAWDQIWALDERRGLIRRPLHQPVQLTSGPIHWNSPFPSKDGGKIFASGATPRGELVRFDSKSNELQPFLGGLSAEFLCFSKDGSQVAYTTFPDGVLWRAKRDGSERVQLTGPPIYPLLCRWSPDGTQILFTAERSSSESGIYVMSTQGGNPRLIVPAKSGVRPGDGGWSPDGHKIVYHDVSSPSLWIFDLDRGETSKIPGSEGLYSPRWSPDGRYIAAFSGDSQMIRLFDTGTREWSSLVPDLGVLGFLTWSHDSRFLYVLKRDEPWAINRVEVAGGKPVRVADLAGFHPTGYLSFWFGLDPNDAPLLLRDAGTSDIYALTLERK